MTRQAHDACHGCPYSRRNDHSRDGYWCSIRKEYHKDGCLAHPKNIQQWAVQPKQDKWLVSSKKTGVVCHASTTREGAERWSKRFLGEHGEVSAA